MVAAGDTVLVEARYKATAKATGKALDAQVAHVWDLQDGKVVRFPGTRTPGSLRR